MKKQARKPAGAVSGKFVTEMFSYEGGRQVTVYVPPDPPEAIIFAGDGQRISQWGRMLEKADVPSTMIAGAHGLTDEMLRLQEYSSGFAPERFEAHDSVLRRGRSQMDGVAVWCGAAP